MLVTAPCIPYNPVHARFGWAELQEGAMAAELTAAFDEDNVTAVKSALEVDSVDIPLVFSESAFATSLSDNNC